MNLPFPAPWAAAALATFALSAALQAAAADDKLVVPDRQVAPFSGLAQWIGVRDVGELPPPASALQQVTLGGATRVGTAQAAEPQPVILGQPDFPLVGAAGTGTGRWGSTPNYQGVQMRLVVAGGSGRPREFRPLGARLAAGERFKIRVLSTFDAVASIDLVRGDAWYGQRAGQVWPAPGLSVAMAAGEAVDLPLERDAYFVASSGVGERYLVVVRHGKAVGSARSGQPVYRQDVPGGSNYLQLVPRGNYPSIEQMILAPW